MDTRTGLSAHRKGLAIVGLIVLSAAWAFILANSSHLFHFIIQNSDLLTAAAFVQNLLRQPDTAVWFQHALAPSLFPDLLAYLLLSLAAPGWKMAALLYAIVAFVGFVVVAGAVVSRIAGRSLASGMAAFLCVAALATLVDVLTRVMDIATLLVFLPIIHAGSFILSLAGLLLARQAMSAPSVGRLGALLLLAAVTTLSDRLFIGSFLLPLLGAGLLVALPGTTRRGKAKVLAVAMAGCLLGIQLDDALFSTWLLRQPERAVDLAVQLDLLPRLLREADFQKLVGATFALALLPLAWRSRGTEANFWWLAAIVAAAGSLGPLFLLYEGFFVQRYVQPVWWWLAIMAAAVVPRAAPRRAVAGLWAAAMVGLGAVGMRQDAFQGPTFLLRYQNPLAQCLAPYHKAGVVHAGLGEYWLTRPVVASSDWSMQIENIAYEGTAYLVSNNRLHYFRDKDDPERAPSFDFVLMSRLDRKAIEARFGPPARVIACPGSAVWVYTPADDLGSKIGGIKTARSRDGLTPNSYCFAPQSFMTRSGKLSPDGLQVPVSAVPREIATWGPYAPLAPARWRFELRYSLEGDANADARWDIATDAGESILARGTLERTGPAPRTMTTTLGIPRGTPAFELRTLLQPGDRLRIESLRATQAGSLPKPCAP